MYTIIIAAKQKHEQEANLRQQVQTQKDEKERNDKVEEEEAKCQS